MDGHVQIFVVYFFMYLEMPTNLLILQLHVLKIVNYCYFLGHLR